MGKEGREGNGKEGREELELSVFDAADELN